MPSDHDEILGPPIIGGGRRGHPRKKELERRCKTQKQKLKKS